MTPQNNNLDLSEKQPLADTLRKEVPVNYYLFSSAESKKGLNRRPAVKSTFYNTDFHIVYDFYKSISNIV